MRWRAKDPFSSYSHMVGILLSIMGFGILMTRTNGSARLAAGFMIYGATLILLYSASTVYHWASLSPRGDDWLRRFDHIAIFLLIAGSYTPVALVTLRGGWGWSVFAAVWSLALAGTVLKIACPHLPRTLSAGLYVGMGWLSVLVLPSLMQRIPLAGLSWLVGGGLAYTIGAVIYSLERPDPFPEVFGHHEVFHLFVLAGSVLQFVFMARYVAAGV